MGLLSVLERNGSQFLIVLSKHRPIHTQRRTVPLCGGFDFCQQRAVRLCQLSHLLFPGICTIWVSDFTPIQLELNLQEV